MDKTEDQKEIPLALSKFMQQQRIANKNYIEGVIMEQKATM